MIFKFPIDTEKTFHVNFSDNTTADFRLQKADMDGVNKIVCLHTTNPYLSSFDNDKNPIYILILLTAIKFQ